MRVIFYTDLHCGPPHEPASKTDVRLHGQNALAINAALLEYAIRHNINDIIHGGDESTFAKGDLTRHMRRASLIGGSMNYQPSDLHRVIGNHDPAEKLDESGFKKDSYSKTMRDKKTKIIICQPEIIPARMEAPLLYAYNTQKILRISPKRDVHALNLIIAAHWAFDRSERGYKDISGGGYNYHDTTLKLKEHFKHNARKNMQRVLSVHGHEHRFSLTDNLRFNCLVMPSIVQADIDNPNTPCGLFVEITDDGPEKTLRLSFKKMTSSNFNGDVGELDYRVQDVDLAYMNRYYRPGPSGLNRQ